MPRPRLRPSHVLAVVWLTLPIGFGSVLDPRLASLSAAAGRVAAGLLWLAWGGVLFAILVPRTITLTVVRVATPATLVLVVVGATASPPPSAAAVAGTTTAAVLGAAVALSPTLGAEFVDGSSYGPERRWALRPPAALYLGPVPVAWAVTVAGLVVPPVLLLHGRWVTGAVAAAVGLPLAALAARALHALARRWLVDVPGGIVVHDHLTVADPVLLPRRAIRTVGPATDDPPATGRLDLTAGAAGAVVELGLDRPVDLLPASRRGGPPAELAQATALLVAPTQTAEFLTAH